MLVLLIGQKKEESPRRVWEKLVVVCLERRRAFLKERHGGLNSVWEMAHSEVPSSPSVEWAE